jgi:hypothetical protein
MSFPPGLSWPPARMPLYWMHEQSGRMKEIIRKFLKPEPLNEWELEILRWYVKQWTEAMPFKPKDYGLILILPEKDLRKYIANVLVEKHGIDPF